MPDLTQEEEEQVATGPVLDERIERMHSLARTMCDTFEERLIALASLEQRAWRADLEGDEENGITVGEKKQLEQKPLFIADLKVCRRLRDSSVGGAEAKLSVDAMALARHLYGAKESAKSAALKAEERRRNRMYDATNKGDDDAVSEVGSSSSMSSAYFDNVNLEEWIGELDAAAALVQSVWRGNRVRQAIRDLLFEAAVIRIQQLARGFLVRKRFQRMIAALTYEGEDGDAQQESKSSRAITKARKSDRRRPGHR